VSAPSHGNAPEATIRKVLDTCADCDVCRFLMEESCPLFPELYRLYDREKTRGAAAGQDELRRLSERCTLCGLCPCPDIRMDVIRSKAERVRAEGMALGTRLLADVQRAGQWGMRAPGIFRRVLSPAPVNRWVKKAMGIHPQRALPSLPHESFFAWARRRGLDRKPERGPKVAYFVGCTAGYLFPEVARAAVTVLERRGVSVFVPPQQCCGMPTLLEGDARATLRRMGPNLKVLLKAAKDGFDIVCSCPTCGFLMKVLLKEGAYYSDAYQRKVEAGEDEIKVPAPRKSAGDAFVRLKKSMYETILKDDGCFSDFDALERIALSETVTDMGEYLGRLDRDQGLNPDTGRPGGRMVYYAPCHQRQQGIGSPYLHLLNGIPGSRVEAVGGPLDCCGMGGSLGLKKDFHDISIGIASPLIRKIRAAAPEAVVTDCLSCRLQFRHLLPYPVYHPLEIISSALDHVVGDSEVRVEAHTFLRCSLRRHAGVVG